MAATVHDHERGEGIQSVHCHPRAALGSVRPDSSQACGFQSMAHAPLLVHPRPSAHRRLEWQATIRVCLSPRRVVIDGVNRSFDLPPSGENQLGQTVEPGSFGENLTLEGMAVRRRGTAVLEDRPEAP